MGASCVHRRAGALYSPRHNRLCWLSHNRADERAYKRHLKARTTEAMPLVRRIPMALKIDSHALTNRVKASFTPVGNCADSPEPLLEPSPAMGHDPEIREATICNRAMMQHISARGGALCVTAVNRQVCGPRHADSARCRAERAVSANLLYGFELFNVQNNSRRRGHQASRLSGARRSHGRGGARESEN
jgi:hypothetical protein